MYLNLEKLRKEYKVFRKKDPSIAERVDVLISITKLEMRHTGEARSHQINAFLTSLNLSLRTIQRWKQIYRENGAACLGKKIASGRPPGELSLKIKRIIKRYRTNYRWGSEVIQAHLKFDHSQLISCHH